jgi:hypothetical protein
MPVVLKIVTGFNRRYLRTHVFLQLAIFITFATH